MGPSVQSVELSTVNLGRRRNVLEQAENVGIEYLDIDVELPGSERTAPWRLKRGTAAALHYLLLRAIAGQRQLQYKRACQVRLVDTG